MTVVLHVQIDVLRQTAAEAKAHEEAMKLELRREAVLRKKAYNQIRELKGNIRVLARVRPAAVGAQGSLNPSAPVALQVSKLHSRAGPRPGKSIGFWCGQQQLELSGYRRKKIQ